MSEFSRRGFIDCAVATVDLIGKNAPAAIADADRTDFALKKNVPDSWLAGPELPKYLPANNRQTPEAIIEPFPLDRSFIAPKGGPA